MATFAGAVRRGLPRVPGGEPWPPAGIAPVGEAPVGEAPIAEAPATVAAAADAPVADAVVAGPATVGAAPAVSPVVVDASAAPSSAVAPGRTVRRGLPRVAGGEPWPPAAAAASVAATVAASASIPAGGAPASAPEAVLASASPEPTVAAPASAPEAVLASASPEPTVAAPASATASVSVPTAGLAVRRGLPRVVGGEPWPPASFVPSSTPAPEPAPAAAAAAAPAPTTQTPAAPTPAAPTPAQVSRVREVLPFTPTVFEGAAAAQWNRDRARSAPTPTPEPTRIGPFTRLQWAGAVIIGGAGLLIAAGMLVLAVRWLVSLDGMQEFFRAFPGEYHLPDTAPVGIPAWIGWQHFFNVFLMVLIIRSGLQVRREKRPSVFWSPRGDKKRKISLALWFHQSLDILWLVNGAIFVVLLFVTGQWLRLVPTSWEVFPNAISAGLQYVSLDWPTENGWVNYNSLQQLAYFTTVFVAAPLAAITGVRMSGVWPKYAETLNRLYPVEWARKVHFPVMLYFVAFIIVHVALVFATGALRNLNHMYASQDAVNWTGFWIFVASMIVIAGGWVAARPLVLAPIARLFGTVKGR